MIINDGDLCADLFFWPCGGRLFLVLAWFNSFLFDRLYDSGHLSLL
jgi:hypothetical protein